MEEEAGNETHADFVGWHGWLVQPCWTRTRAPRCTAGRASSATQFGRTIKARDLAENVHIIHSLMSEAEKRCRGAVRQINGQAGGEQCVHLSREPSAPSLNVIGR